MSNYRLLTLSAALLTAVAAHAQDTAPLTRAQVLAELHAAQAAGAVPHGDLDISARNGGPDDAPARTAASTLTRAQVVAELKQAEKAGDVQVGDSGRTLAEINPSAYPLPRPQPGLTRAQVVAELHEAIQRGDIPFGDEGRTMAEAFPQRYAAARAAAPRQAQAHDVATHAPAPAKAASAAHVATR